MNSSLCHVDGRHVGYSGKTDLHDSWKLLPSPLTAKTLLHLAFGGEKTSGMTKQCQLQALVGCDLPSSSPYQRVVYTGIIGILENAGMS